jgi:hypothetical protein
LSRIHAFGGDEVFGVLLVVINVSETDGGHWGASTAVVDNVLNNTLNIPFSLSEIEVSELRLGHAQMAVGLKNTLLVTSSLTANNTSHLDFNIN